MRKHTFIHGANGFGKSTICAILRSLRTGDAAHVIGRRTLDSEKPPLIKLLINDRPVQFTGAGWGETHPDLAIFDGVFVNENVHTGDVVDADHRRGLCRTVIGYVGVQLAEEEERLVREIREKTSEITALRKTIETHLPKGTRLDQFIAIAHVEDIDERIRAQRAELAATREASTIVQRASLLELVASTLPDGLKALLGKTLDDIATGAEWQVAQHLEAHGMARASGEWLAKGLDQTTDSCPFCGQNVSGLSLIAAYQAVFGESYKALRAEIFAMIATVEKMMGEAAVARLAAVAEQHAAAVAFWERHCLLEVEALCFPGAIADSTHALGAATLSLLAAKARAPLEGISADASFEVALLRHQAELERVDVFNQAVRRAHGLINARKAEIGAANVLVVSSELDRLILSKLRYESAVVEMCDEYAERTKEKTRLEQRKPEIRRELDEHADSVMKPYEQRLNQLLENFGAEFSLSGTSHGYTGGVAALNYRIVINQVSVDIGNTETPREQPCFGNTLSAGDRSTLAIAFFIAHLERDPKLSGKIVVFDDPFNSQDGARRSQTVQEIMRIAEKCAQVLVLSHDAAFLKQIWTKCQPGDRVALALVSHGEDGSKIVAHDLEQACQGRVADDADHLRAYITRGVGQPIDIVRKMRPLLETHLRLYFPTMFENAKWLGDMINEIRQSGISHPAHQLYDDLDAVNDYTKTFHHGEDLLEAEFKSIDPQELNGFAKRTLRIMHGAAA